MRRQITKLRGKNYVLVPFEVYGKKEIMILTPSEYNRGVRRAKIHERWLKSQKG